MMEMYKEMLAAILEKENAEIIFPQLKINAAEIISQECYQTLQKIKAIINDDSLSDGTCFLKMEEIVSLFEAYGVDTGNRHDFG